MRRLALVTGAAGFIGSHLVEKLLGEEFEVIGIDNLSIGRIENLDTALSHNNFRFVKADIEELEESDLLLADEQRAIYVFHLAALADIVPSIQSPKSYISANVMGTMKILEFARGLKIEKFVYAASSSCYGLPDIFPTPETALVSPEYPYALSKYLGEELVLHWAKVYKVPAISLRLFNVYGPRARTSGTYGAVFGVFLAQKLAGVPLTIVGDGNQTRDFTYVTDVVDAFFSAAVSEARNEVFNVGSGGTYSVNRLAELIGGDVTYIPKRPGEPDCTFADIRKISTKLNWKPKVNFSDGVNLVKDNLNAWVNAPVWTPESIQKETDLWFKLLGKKESNAIKEVESD